jgi:hypothetical protein
MMAKVGNIVHYVMPSGPTMGEHRPAIVVQNWVSGIVNLQVFIDGSNDGYPYSRSTIWAQNIAQSENKEPGTWHVIEPEEPEV